MYLQFVTKTHQSCVPPFLLTHAEANKEIIDHQWIARPHEHKELKWRRSWWVIFQEICSAFHTRRTERKGRVPLFPRVPLQISSYDSLSTSWKRQSTQTKIVRLCSQVRRDTLDTFRKRLYQLIKWAIVHCSSLWCDQSYLRLSRPKCSRRAEFVSFSWAPTLKGNKLMFLGVCFHEARQELSKKTGYHRCAIGVGCLHSLKSVIQSKSLQVQLHAI